MCLFVTLSCPGSGVLIRCSCLLRIGWGAAQILPQHGQCLEGPACLTAQFGLECAQVAPHAELTTMFVRHAQVHEQMRGQHVQLEIIALHVQAGLVAHGLEQRVRQAALGKARILLQLGRQTRGTFRQRHKAAARALRQALEQGLDLVLEHAGHQPFGAVFAHLIQCEQRHFHGHAVTRIAGLVQIRRATIHTAQADGAREQVGRDAGRFVPHQFFPADLQQPGLTLAGAAEPFFQLVRIGDISRNLRIVEGVDQLVIHQHVLPARLVLQLLNLPHHLAVGGQKRQRRFPIVAHQRLTNEDLARADRIDTVVIHAAVVVDHDAVERGAFQRHHLAGLLLPVRIQQLLAQQVTTHLFQPLRLDIGNAAAEQARGLHQLRAGNPAPGLLAQVRARMAPELDAARAQIPVFVLALDTDVAQQARQHALVQLGVAGWRHIVLPALLARHRQQLAVDVAPFAHAAHVDEVLAQQGFVLAIAELVGWCGAGSAYGVGRLQTGCLRLRALACARLAPRPLACWFRLIRRSLLRSRHQTLRHRQHRQRSALARLRCLLRTRRRQ